MDVVLGVASWFLNSLLQGRLRRNGQYAWPLINMIDSISYHNLNNGSAGVSKSKQ